MKWLIAIILFGLLYHILSVEERTSVWFFGKNENDILIRSIINHEIYGNNGDYTLFSSSGDNHLFWVNGNDTLIGSHGDDYLSGNDRNGKIYVNYYSDRPG